MEVPFFNYQYFSDKHGPAVLDIMRNVVERGAFIMQKDLAEFEKNLAVFVGVRHAIGVANCTDGLALSLETAGIRSGDEVIFPSHTFIATAGAINEVGGKPVPVDIASDHLIDPESIRAAITSNTRAIVPVQLNGRVARMDTIQAIADQHDLVIVEDAAQSLGAMYMGTKAGAFGLSAAFSFYPAKVLGCFGDGGAVVTNDDNVAEDIFAKRDHGRNKDGFVDRWGRNSRLDNIHAAVLNYFLDQYDNVMVRRREIAAIYDQELRGLNSLYLPPAPQKGGDYFDIYQNYEIEAEQRDELQAFLQEQNIGTLKQWGGHGVHQFSDLGFAQSLQNVEKMMERAILLPINMSLSDDEVLYVSKNIREFYNAGS